MDYKEMISHAKENGITTEKAMWSGIDRVEKLLKVIKEEHPEKYWKFMRKSHEDIYGPHYNKEFANMDVESIAYTDADGEEHHGAHWTKDEIASATKGKSFPEGTTDWDKYVAYNAAYADFCRKFTEEDVLDIAYLLYFDDEDYGGDGKIFECMTTMQY